MARFDGGTPPSRRKRSFVKLNKHGLFGLTTVLSFSRNFDLECYLINSGLFIFDIHMFDEENIRMIIKL